MNKNKLYISLPDRLITIAVSLFLGYIATPLYQILKTFVIFLIDQKNNIDLIAPLVLLLPIQLILIALLIITYIGLINKNKDYDNLIKLYNLSKEKLNITSEYAEKLEKINKDNIDTLKNVDNIIQKYKPKNG